MTTSLVRLIVLFISLSQAPTVFAAKPKPVLELDCNNHCAFQSVEHNCHGVRFRYDGELKFTHWSALTQRCVHNGFIHRWSVKPSQIQAACDCTQTPFPHPLPGFEDRRAPLTDKTRADLVELQKKVKDWAWCGPDPLKLPEAKNVLYPYTRAEIDTCENLKAKGIEGYLVGAGCLESQNDNCDYYGNTMNVSGIYCLMGDEDRCLDVKKAQNPVTGGWYRSAWQMRFPLAEQGQPPYSRDEVLGMLAYFTKTHDREAAMKWLKFLAHNPKKNSSIVGKLDKIHNICPPLPKKRPPEISEERWQSMQPDDRCEMRPDTWAMMGLVYDHIGISPWEIIKVSPAIWTKMEVSKPIKNLTLNISARTVPAVGGGSYQAALQASSILLLRKLGVADSVLVQNAAKVIHRRHGRSNPYFQWLARDGEVTEYGANLIKLMCPVQRPYYGPLPGGGVARAALSFFDSSTQYFGGKNAYGETPQPHGHDCLAWLNLYLN